MTKKQINTQTAEERTSETLLQAPIGLKIGGRRYKVEQPTFGTMVAVSAIIARNDEKLELDGENITPGMLRFAKDGIYMADILATFILGAKRLRNNIPNSLKNIGFRLSHLTWKSPERYLRDEILDNCTNAELARMFTRLIGATDVGSFFAVITFLKDIDLTKPTKVMENGTTAHGQSSQASSSHSDAQ